MSDHEDLYLDESGDWPDLTDYTIEVAMSPAPAWGYSVSRRVHVEPEFPWEEHEEALVLVQSGSCLTYRSATDAALKAALKDLVKIKRKDKP